MKNSWNSSARMHYFSVFDISCKLKIPMLPKNNIQSGFIAS